MLTHTEAFFLAKCISSNFPFSVKTVSVWTSAFLRGIGRASADGATNSLQKEPGPWSIAWELFACLRCRQLWRLRNLRLGWWWWRRRQRRSKILDCLTYMELGGLEERAIPRIPDEKHGQHTLIRSNITSRKQRDIFFPSLIMWEPPCAQGRSVSEAAWSWDSSENAKRSKWALLQEWRGIVIFFLTFICPLVGEGTRATTLTWRSEDSLWDLFLLFCDIGPCRLGGHGYTLWDLSLAWKASSTFQVTRARM